MYILNEVETSHHLISIRLYFILTTLITEDNHNIIFAEQLQLSYFFFITYNKMKIIYITLSKTVPTFNKIVEICKFDISNTHINEP
jgi:hypothetical protein